MKKLLLPLLTLVLFFNGCKIDDKNKIGENWDPLTLGTIKSDTLFYSDSETINKETFSFTPNTTGKYTINLGINKDEDADILVYTSQDQEDSNLKGQTFSYDGYGDELTLSLSAGNKYYIVLKNRSNISDLEYNIVINKSLPDGYYSENLPFIINTDSSEISLLTHYAYDTISESSDDNKNKIYGTIKLNIDKTMFLKTINRGNSYRNLDITIYDENNNTLGSRTCDNGNIEQIKINFSKNATYKFVIENIDNTEDYVENPVSIQLRNYFEYMNSNVACSENDGAVN